MFEVKRSEGIKVRIYGDEFLLKKPSVKMIQSYAIDLDKAGQAEQFERAKTLLTEMGLKSELVDEMEIDHLEQLIKFLTSEMSNAAKKN